MFTRTKKRAFPLQIPSVRRSRPNIKVKQTNQFLNDREDNHIEEEPENDSLFNLQDDASTLNSSDDINYNNDTLPHIEDDSDNNDDSLPENDGFFNLEDDASTLNSDDINDNVTLPQTADDNDDSLPQTTEDEQNAHFEPIPGEYGPYFNNFTEQMLFFWTTKHIISR
jgi:hypothetical protein